MHSHPTSKGQPSASPKGVFPTNTPHSSVHGYSGTHQANTAQTSNSVSKPHHQHIQDNDPSTVDQGLSPHWVEQLQLALAIANPELLQQLVLNCQAPLVASHQLGSISAAVSVPVYGSHAVDSVLSVEVIACQLSQDADGHTSAKRDRPVQSHARSLDAAINASDTLTPEELAHQKALVNQICRETKLQTLGMNIPLPEAIALLQYATFSLPDIQRILNLPYNGWHRSWWAMVDPSVEQTLCSPNVSTVGFTIPFKRLIRSRRYADGTVMLQYKDQFAHIPPPCFRTQQRSVLVHIQRPNQSISDILAWMNHAKTTLNADYGLLLYHHLSPIEQQALRNQGLYLYHCASSDPGPSSGSPSHATYPHQSPHDVAGRGGILESSNPPSSESIPSEPVNVNVLADCRICRQQQCPMYGQAHSPVIACRLFHVD